MNFLMEKQSLKTFSLVHLQLQIRRPDYKFTLIQPHLNKVPEQTQKKKHDEMKIPKVFLNDFNWFWAFLASIKTSNMR